MNVVNKNSTIFLSGKIDEDFDFTQLELPANNVVIDLSNVSRVNAVGIRSWMRFLVCNAKRSIAVQGISHQSVELVEVFMAIRGQ